MPPTTRSIQCLGENQTLQLQVCVPINTYSFKSVYTDAALGLLWKPESSSMPQSLPTFLFHLSPRPRTTSPKAQSHSFSYISPSKRSPQINAWLQPKSTNIVSDMMRTLQPKEMQIIGRGYTARMIWVFVVSGSQDSR